MNKLKEIIERVKEYEDNNCFELKTSVVLHWLNEIQKEAINYTHCCKSDSEQLRDEKEPTTWDAFLAGYKKKAEMSGLKYDEVSELHAKTLYKCWNSFDLNP